MLIDIFCSCPTDLSDSQEKIRRLLFGELGRVGLFARQLGKTDYPNGLPLREVLTLGRHCSGGLILGFSQFVTKVGISRGGTPHERVFKETVAFPTPWNQLEAGILFSLDLPLLVFREPHVAEEGIFDRGVTDLFIHDMPKRKTSAQGRKALKEVFSKWAAKVHEKYHC